MSLGGQSDIYAAQGGIPSIFNRLAAGDASGGIPVDNSKYAQIMELMRRRNAMNNSTYTGGFNPYAVAAPSRPYDDLIARQGSANQEMVGGRGDIGPTGGFNNYGGVNTNRGLIEGILSSSMMGRIANALGSKQDPSLVTVEDRTFTPVGVSNAQAIADAAEAEGFSLGPQATSTTGISVADMAEAEGFGLGPAATGDFGGGNDSVGGGFGGNDGSGEGFGGIYSRGGYVNKKHLKGPNPMGPDDGYGGLDDGEYVINAKSVGKYGIELMNAINAGKISKGKLRGLLEA